MLTPHCSAASGIVVPPSSVWATRLRKSAEYGFAIHAGLLPAGSLNHIRAALGIPDSSFPGNALVHVPRPLVLPRSIPTQNIVRRQYARRSYLSNGPTASLPGHPPCPRAVESGSLYSSNSSSNRQAPTRLPYSRQPQL